MTINSIRQQIESIRASINASAGEIHLIPEQMQDGARAHVAALSTKLDGAVRLTANVEHRLAKPDVENTAENEARAIHIERLDEVVAKVDEMAKRLAAAIAKLTAK